MAKRTYLPIFIVTLVALCDLFTRFGGLIIAAATTAGLSSANIATLTSVMATLQTLCAPLLALVPPREY